MVNTATNILIFEAIILVNAILAIAIMKLLAKKKETALLDEAYLNQQATELYHNMNTTTKNSLSLSLGQEDPQKSSCPTFSTYLLCEEESKEWTMTY